MTSYADAMMAHPHVARELRAYRGLEIPAARLLGAAFSDAGFIESGLQELVDRGILRPVRYAPWFGTPIIMPIFAFGCGTGSGVTNDTWEGRRSHRMQWVYRVCDGTEKPSEDVEHDHGIDLSRWKASARHEVMRLHLLLSSRHDRMQALDRMQWLGDEWVWCGSRRSRRRHDKASRALVAAMDAWRRFALMAYNMVR